MDEFKEEIQAVAVERALDNLVEAVMAWDNEEGLTLVDAKNIFNGLRCIAMLLVGNGMA